MREQKTYTRLEEQLNILTHGFGCLLSIFGLILLVNRATVKDDIWSLVSFSVFGVSMILLYAASTLYHSAKDQGRRFQLRILDHAMIYTLIAGSYTPFTLVTLRGQTGWILFGIVWGCALTGIIVKLFFIGKFPRLSTVMYILMGWVGVLAFKPILANIETAGVYWLVAGGLTYTLGAILYSLPRIKYNHAIWHLFVLGGSFCHFMAVWAYV